MQRLPLRMLLCVVLLLTSPLLGAESPLVSRPVSIAKETTNEIEVVKSFLAGRMTGDRVKVWLFFTDKAISDDAQFAKAAAVVRLNEHGRARRAKVGLDKVTFGDLPVSGDYINEVIQAGGKLRRISRWLNAASFEIAFDKIDVLNNFPFVAKIRPVAVFTGAEDKIESMITEGPTTGFLSPAALDYGANCIGQLNQINVPAVHDLGFNGNGVIVAMLDTGYRKNHEAFADAFSTGRVLAEYDFIFSDGNTQNEGSDDPSQHNHGTYTWSTLGGAFPGKLYGPAYGASFLLAKTEDVRSETAVEEDNWMAAVEWADSYGADVISSSLGYTDWYVYANYNGQTCVTTVAANLATSYGIVVCNSMGNAGPGSGTLGAPADAFEILSVGAVNSAGSIASFSSRGPTYDGRIKPELCAQGVSTYCATANGTTTYGGVSGTSLSTPLIGGCAAVLLSARPSLTPQQVRLALMQTSNNAANPNNSFGSGIANLRTALDWGAKIGANVSSGVAPLTVSFIDSSYVASSSWNWTFGDSQSSIDQNPEHVYSQPGAYDVSLQILSDGRQLPDARSKYIIVTADTLRYEGDTVYAGEKLVVAIELTNAHTLNQIYLPFDYAGFPEFMNLDSISVAGTRGAGFYISTLADDGTGKKRIYRFLNSGTPLSPGSGIFARFYFSTDPYAYGGLSVEVDSVSLSDFTLTFGANGYSYMPVVHSGRAALYAVQRGDANNDDRVNVGDAVLLLNNAFSGGPDPITIQSGDANMDFVVNVGDVVFLINFIFKSGPPPAIP